MGISIADAKKLTWWEYGALVWGHGDDNPANEPVEPPTPESILALSHRVELRGLARMIH